MFRTFSLIMLITSILLSTACKSTYTSTVNSGNTSIDEQINTIDSNLVAIYLPYKSKLDSDMKRVISICDKDMVKDKPESGLTNLLADLLLEEGKAEAENKAMHIVPEVSFFNYGGIRTGLQKGNVTVEKAFELMPFENEMVLVQLTGEQLQQFYNKVAADGGGSVGGVRFIISGEKAKNISINGKPIRPENKYWLVTNDYAANGGDDFSILKQRLDFKSSGVKIRDIIIRNFEKKQKAGITLTENLDGRISHE